jgi:hypothetical protein
MVSELPTSSPQPKSTVLKQTPVPRQCCQWTRTLASADCPESATTRIHPQARIAEPVPLKTGLEQVVRESAMGSPASTEPAGGQCLTRSDLLVQTFSNAPVRLDRRSSCVSERRECDVRVPPLPAPVSFAERGDRVRRRDLLRTAAIAAVWPIRHQHGGARWMSPLVNSPTCVGCIVRAERSAGTVRNPGPWHERSVQVKTNGWSSRARWPTPGSSSSVPARVPWRSPTRDGDARFDDLAATCARQLA